MDTELQKNRLYHKSHYSEYFHVLWILLCTFCFFCVHTAACIWHTDTNKHALTLTKDSWKLKRCCGKCFKQRCEYKGAFHSLSRSLLASGNWAHTSVLFYLKKGQWNTTTVYCNVVMIINFTSTSFVKAYRRDGHRCLPSHAMEMTIFHSTFLQFWQVFGNPQDNQD